MEDQTLDLLAYHAFPRVAAAIRARFNAILQKWEQAVRQTLPEVDDLTLRQLRDNIPTILREIADALGAQTPAATRELAEYSKVHGQARFVAQYDLRELVIEYRLLRRIIIEQVSEELPDRLDARQNVALNMAVDTAVQSGMLAFTDQQRERIEAATEVQSKYMAFMSHDLRNHLNHATLVLELLGQRMRELPDCEQSVADVESIQRSIFQTTAGMDRLLQAERLRKEAFVPTLSSVELKPSLDEIMHHFAHDAEAKGLALEVNVPDGAQAQTDRELLMLVLQNLLGNAVKYSTRGRIKLTARPMANGTDSGWLIDVTDDGPGIAPENLARLFEAFRRGNTHGQPGVGLGLSIAAQASKLLGASLEVESELGKGSTFRVVLPKNN